MIPSAEFLIILAALAAAWLSLRADIRALVRELRQINGDPALRDRDIEFNEALARVTQGMNDPVSAARSVTERDPWQPIVTSPS